MGFHISEELEDAASRERMSAEEARRIGKMTYQEVMRSDDLFNLFSENGDPVEYNEKYGFKSFRIKTSLFRRYTRYCINNKLNIYRFINEILTEWLNTKQIQEQDKIEREAHNEKM